MTTIDFKAGRFQLRVSTPINPMDNSCCELREIDTETAIHLSPMHIKDLQHVVNCARAFTRNYAPAEHKEAL